MTYIDQMNAFWSQNTFNPISCNAIGLYMALMQLFNKSRWQSKIQVSNITIMSMTELSEKQFRTTRAELVKAGLIKYIAGRKGMAATYELTELCDEGTDMGGNEGTNMGTNEGSDSDGNMGANEGSNMDADREAMWATYKEKDKDIDKEKDIDIYNPPISPQGETKPKRRNAKAELKTENEAAARIVQLYNSTCTSLPKCTKLTPERRAKVKARLKTFGETRIAEALIKAEQSDFLKGLRGGWGGANFDWLFKNDSNMLKILEGNYDNDKQQRAAPQTDAMFTPTQGISDIEAAFMAQWN